MSNDDQKRAIVEQSEALITKLDPTARSGPPFNRPPYTTMTDAEIVAIHNAAMIARKHRRHRLVAEAEAKRGKDPRR